MTTAEPETGPLTVEVDLGGVRAVPLRIAIGVLSTGPWLWAAFAVLSPLAVLASQLLWPTNPPAVVFVSGFVSFVLWMAPIRYDRSRTTVDASAREVRIGRPTGTGADTQDVHDLETVEHATIKRLGPVALVSLRSDSSSTSYPTFVASENDLPAMTTALESAGVETISGNVLEPGSTGLLARLVVTLLVAIGVPAVAVWRFGPGVLAGALGLLGLVAIALLGGRGLRWLLAR